MDRTTLTHNFQAIASTCKAIESLGFLADHVVRVDSRKPVFIIREYLDDRDMTFFGRFDSATGILETKLRLRRYDDRKKLDFMTRLSLLLTAAYKPVAELPD